MPNNITIVLPLDYWERIVEIVDSSGHSDSLLLLQQLHGQIYGFTPAPVPQFIQDKDNPNKMKRT